MGLGGGKGHGSVIAESLRVTPCDAKEAAVVDWQSEYGLPESLRKRAAASRVKFVRGGLSAVGGGRRSRVAGRKRERAPDSEACSSSNVESGKHMEVSASGQESQHVCLHRDRFLTGLKRLDAEFYRCDALELAPRLLGKYLCRDDVMLQITEVEAYRQDDSACHARVGVTPRTAPLFGPGGHAYVYLCYGLHVMLNVIADEAGVGAAVLIRSCAPIAGLKTIQERRKQSTEKPVLLTGPGKVGQALRLTTEWSSHPLYSSGGLEIYDGPTPEEILVGPRVGIDYADAKDVAALWRFAIAGTPWGWTCTEVRDEHQNAVSSLQRDGGLEVAASIHKHISCIMEALSTSHVCSTRADSQAMQKPPSVFNGAMQWRRGDGWRMSPNMSSTSSASPARLWSSFKGPLNQRFGAKGLKSRGYLRGKRNTIRAHQGVTPVRPFEGSGVDEHFLDDVSSYIFRRLHGVLGPLFPTDFDLLSWLPMEIHCKLHKSEVIATLLVREVLMLCLDYFLYTMVERFCRWAWRRSYKPTMGPQGKEMVVDYEQSVFRALQHPLRFTIVLWALTRAFHHVAPLFRVTPHVHWVGNTRAIGLTLAGTWFLSNWKRMFVRKLANENKIDAPRIVAADKVISLLLYYLAASTVGEITGFGLRSLLAVGGISSIAVGLAAKEIVSNFFGGSVLFLTRPFVIGEKIKAGQFSGQVQDIGFLQTKILGFDKVPVLVPNQAFINQVITNYSRAKGKLLDAVFTVRNQDIFLVDRITTRVLQYLHTHPNVDKGMGAPTCYLKSLGSMGTDIALTCVIPTKAGIDYYQEQQSILVRVAQIIVEEGASLGSNAPFSPSVPATTLNPELAASSS